jgi:hypothetical protein
VSGSEYRGQGHYTEGDDQEIQRQLGEQEERDQKIVDSIEAASNETYDRNLEQEEPQA